MRKAIFLLALLLSLPIVQAQQTPLAVPDWVRWISGFWLIFLFAAFFLIAIAYIIKGVYGRTLAIIGIGSLFLSILTVLASVLLPLLWQPTVAYEQCKTMFKPDVALLTFPGIVYTASCILTGYAPAGLEWLTVTTFIIFGIILPIAISISLFWEFVPEALIKSQPVRRVLAVALALIAYRGAFATFFVEMLSYGAVGMLALLVAVLFTGMVWKVAQRFVESPGKKIAEELEYIKMGEVEWLQRRLMELRAAYNSPTTPDSERPKILDEISKITKRLKELGKEVEKREGTLTFM